MAPDLRFFPTSVCLTIEEIAVLAGADIVRRVDDKRLYTNVAPLRGAQSGDVSFLDNKVYARDYRSSNAGCCIVHRDLLIDDSSKMEIVASEQPYLSYARVATAFHPEWDNFYYPLNSDDHVHKSVDLGKGAVICDGSVIGPNVVIGDNSVIGPNVYIGDGVMIGNNCRIGSSVSIRYSLIGNNVSIYSGARLGEPGFGFASSESGPVNVPQLGRVIIGDDVEVGANTTIDRGAGPDTVIGDGTRIDNLVQIGHNVQIGRMCVIVAQAGIAGSTVIGDGAQIGGQAGIAGHLHVGERARVAGSSGVMKDVESGATVAGIPSVPIRQWLRQSIAVAGLVTTRKR